MSSDAYDCCYCAVKMREGRHDFMARVGDEIVVINGLERINKELKRRTRVVGAFPSDSSFMRLGVSILIDINEEWLTTKRYLSMDESKHVGYRAI